MTWLEVINLRTAGKERTRRAQEFIGGLPRELKAEGLARVKTYHHAAVDTDLSIHLHWDSGTPAAEGSALALRIVEVLSDFGLVHNSVWIDQPVVTGPNHSKK